MAVADARPGIQPEAYDPMVTLIDPRELLAHFARVRASIAQTVVAMPTHADFIRANVRADLPWPRPDPLSCKPGRPYEIH